MKFEEALKAMREGKKVWNRNYSLDKQWTGNPYLQIQGGKICLFENGFVQSTEEYTQYHFNIFKSPTILGDDWYIVKDHKPYKTEYSKELWADLIKPCYGFRCSLPEPKDVQKIDLKITFVGGGEIVIPDEQWDDYRYDGKFFTVVKEGVDIAMYNAKQVYSLVLVRQGD